jgi:uncharacterized membrane protein HdeD (DUF308 family)
MTIPIDRGPLIGLRAGLESLHRNWGWYLALGIVLVVVGTIAICSPVFFTITGVLYFGVLMLFGGIVQLLGAFWARYWSGVIAMVLSGLLYLVVGGMTLRHPGTADLALTLLIATFLMVGGLFRIIAALYLQFHGWGWSVLSGVISTALGVMIYSNLAASTLLVIGIFIGVDMLFQGWTWIALSLAVRKWKPSAINHGA